MICSRNEGWFGVLRYVAVCCSLLQCVAVQYGLAGWFGAVCDCFKDPCPHSGVLQCVAVCCSVLQCVTVCCSVLQHDCTVCD